MSSFKNAVKGLRRTHKERSQPFARRRLGLLEKHKDYVLRARNYHQKQNALKGLREKARNKNPDEFYYKMISSKLKDGEHFYLDRNEKIDEEEKKLLMTQDLKYVMMKLQVEKKKVERLKSQLHLTSGGQERPKLHIVFHDSDVEDEGSEEEAGVGQQPSSQSPQSQGETDLYQELDARRKRLKELGAVVAKMQTKKNLMTDKRPHTFDKKNNVYKWKKERTK